VLTTAPPATDPRLRIALTVGAWLVFGCIETALWAVADRTTRLDMMSVMYPLSLAVAWMLFTPAIIAWMRALDRANLSLIEKVASHAVGISAIALVDALWRRETMIAVHMAVTTPFYATALYYTDLTIAAYLAVLVVGRALDLQDVVVAQTRRQLGLRAQLAQARLDYLDAQLQPHFLFNSLGTVTELAHEAPAAAARMLRQLATLLRFAVNEQGHAVSLRDELHALEPYLDIQRVRFSDWLTIEHDVSTSALDVMVPRLTLQPLVENAIRHGLAGRTERGLIRIIGTRTGDRLRLAVQDDGVGLQSAPPSDGYGIGLRNMRRRLAAAYDDDFTMDLHSAAGGGAVAELSLPTRSHPTTAGPETGTIGMGRMPSRLFETFRRHPISAVTAAWCVWGVFWFQLSYSYLAMRHRLGEEPLDVMIREHVIAVALWAIMTPVAFRIARAMPLSRMSWTTAVHVPLACLFGFAHVGLWQTLAGSADALWAPRYVVTMLWTVLLYAFLLGVAQYRELTDWFRERETGTARLEAELAEARITAAAVRFRPDVVLHALEDVASRVHLDPVRAESELALLADDLRLALERSP
jgi:hypothetical protein